MRGFRLLALSCLFSVGAIPVIVSTHFTFPFIEPKAVLFRLLVDVAIAAWLAALILRQTQALRATPPLLALAAVLASLLVSDVLSPIPWLAILSRTERMEGFILLIHLGAFAALASALLDTPQLQRRFLAAQVTGSAAVGVVGLLSYASYATVGHWEIQVMSTLGNPVFLGQYGALMCCLTVFLWIGAGRRMRWVWAVIALLNFSMVYLSQARGSALAMVVAGLGAAVLLPDTRWRVRILIAAVLAVLILMALPVLIPDLPHLRRFTDSALDDPRFAMWGLAWRIFEARPVFGWGQEGFFVAGGEGQAIDRAHNLLFDWLAQGGVVGAALWAAFLWAIRCGIARLYGPGERAALYGFLIVYLVSNCFLFDTITSYIALSAVAGMVSARWGMVLPVRVRRAALA